PQRGQARRGLLRRVRAGVRGRAERAPRPRRPPAAAAHDVGPAVSARWADQDGRDGERELERRERKMRRDSSTSGGGSIGAYLLHRAKPHLPPWLGVAGVGIAGSGAHLMWAESAAAGVGLTLSAVALTGATWWAGRETSAQR